MTTTAISQAVQEELMFTLAHGSKEEREEAKAELAAINAKLRAERKETVRAVEQAKEQAFHEQAEEQMKAEALREWKLQGGKANEFEIQWPTLKADILRQKTTAAMNRPRTVHF